ncbi:MAG TPA: hypothetical protein VK674_02285 [Candidatus Limnocylindria bacterium]|nr:hypothetical protein [Candidatus Limnocylindria bacterium]
MSKTKLLIFIFVVVVVLGGTVTYLALGRKGNQVKNNGKSVAKVETVNSEPVGMIIERDTSLVQSTPEKEDEESGQMWRFVQPADSQQQFVVSSYYEQGASLKKLTSLTKMPLKEAVLDNVSRQLPQQYPEYKELSQKDITVNGTQATEIVFEYVSQNIPVRQRLLLLFKNSDTVVYIRGQAKAAEYDDINSKYFAPLFASSKFE